MSVSVLGTVMSQLLTRNASVFQYWTISAWARAPLDDYVNATDPICSWKLQTYPQPAQMVYVLNLASQQWMDGEITALKTSFAFFVHRFSYVLYSWFFSSVRPFLLVHYLFIHSFISYCQFAIFTSHTLNLTLIFLDTVCRTIEIIVNFEKNRPSHISHQALQKLPIFMISLVSN
jgi:hypothetical protein